MINAYWEALRFALPEPDGPKNQWRRWIDTSLPSPDDIVKWSAAPAIQGQHYQVAARSLTVLFVLLRVAEVTPP
jgi:glycogen operon protein